MKTVGNYSIIETFGDASAICAHRGIHREREFPVILKEFRKDEQSSFKLAQLTREYRTLMDIRIDGIVGIHEIFETDSRFFLIQEDFEGRPLRSLIQERELSLGLFLDFAVSVCGTLGQLHGNKVIHGNLRPDSILVDPSTGKAKITDIGLPLRIATEPELVRDPDFVRSSLCYISPEQTGRTNREVDYRTDFYSLGVNFYEMLTGEVPFSSQDALGLIFSHIAREAIPPHKKERAVQETVSAIVMKLLHKTPEDRYQSSVGLIADLDRCRRQLADTGRIEPFELATADVSIQFNLPTALFGRTAEIAELKSRYTEVERGENAVTLVAGGPGIGKSSLVFEIQNEIVARGGYFISGKYELHRQDIPYSSIIRAFGDLIQQILTESPEKIDLWKSRFEKAVGSLGRIIVDVIPEVKLVVGDQPPVAHLDPMESQNRFILTVKKFVQSLASREHPLVVFLDDLQWADLASVRLIETLLVDSELHYFYLIGTLRDNEVGEGHPVAAMIKDVKKEKGHLHQLFLTPLSEDSVNALVASFLGSDRAESAPVAKIVYEKTGGNPFFVQQSLKTMYDSKMLELDPRAGWRWNLESISTMEMTDDVAELVIDKIRRLDSESKKILQVGACIGVQFELDTLAAVSRESIDELVDSIVVLLREGLISRRDNGYRFNHDRILEAALSMVSRADRDRYQYAAGRYCLENSENRGVQDRALEIVNKLNAVTHLMKDVTEQHELAALNLVAARKAESSAAYSTALVCCRNGIELLGENRWRENYRLSLNLHILAAQAAYLCTDYDEQEKIASEVLAHAANLMDTIRIYELRIQMFTAQNNLEGAIHTGQKALRLLGLKLPERATMATVVSALAATKMSLFNQSYEDLLNLPEMKSKKMRAIVTVINRVTPATYWSDPNLMAHLIITAARLPIRHGVSSEFAYFYAAYGLILCRIGEIDAGYKFGEVGLALLDRFEAARRAARTLFTFNCFVKHWKDPAADSLDGFKDGYRIALETGDLEFAGYHIMAYCYTSFWVSDNLFTLEKETARYIEEISAIGQKTPLHVIRMDHQRLLNLIYPADQPGCLAGHSYDEQSMVAIHNKAKDRTALFAANSRSSQLSYFFDDYPRALRHSERAEAEIDSVVGTIDYAIFYYYDSIIRLSLCREVTRGNRSAMMKKVAGNQKKVKKWASYSPRNHLHRFLIVEADFQHLKGNEVEARKSFKKALAASRESNCLLDECIARRAYSRYWYEVGEEEIGDYFVKQARDGLKSWGALAVVAHLEQNYDCLKQEKARPAEPDSWSGSRTTGSLDWSTIIKASQAISGEIVLGRLLKKLMELVVENAGARKGILILEENGELRIEARIDIEQDQVFIQDGLKMEESEELSPAIVNYVHRRRETVLLGNAPYEGRFVNDSYISRKRPRSVLCAPIVNQENLSAILYLENDLAIDAFSPERLEILNLLSSQIAISLDNAVLFQKMKTAEQHLKVQNDAIRDQNRTMEFMIAEIQKTYSDLNFANEKTESIRKHLQNIIDSMPSLLIGVDAEMQITLWNSEAEKTIGIRYEDVFGNGLFDILPFLEDYRAGLESVIVSKSSRKFERIENLFEQDGGFFDVTIYPLISDGAYGAVLRIDTVTQRIQIERLMIQTEKMMSIGGLAAGMAHEINNPLNAIVLSAHNIARLLSQDLRQNNAVADELGVSMPKISEYAEKNEIFKMLRGIETMGGRAAKIIENTLNYSRRSESEQKPVDLRNLIEETLELASRDYDLKKKFDFRKVAIFREYCDQMTYVPCVATEIIQVLLNLTRNAVQAMMHCEESRKDPKIIIRLSPAGKYARIDVADNGPGVAEEHLGRLFEPFFTTKEAGVGTGLGLSVSHYIVSENHRGKIEVSSTLGKGTTFSVFLPLGHR